MSINSGDVGVNSAGKSRMASRARQRKGNEEQKDQVLREWTRESERGLEAGFEKENSEMKNDGKYFYAEQVIRRN